MAADNERGNASEYHSEERYTPVLRDKSGDPPPSHDPEGPLTPFEAGPGMTKTGVVSALVGELGLTVSEAAHRSGIPYRDVYRIARDKGLLTVRARPVPTIRYWASGGFLWREDTRTGEVTRMGKTSG